MEWPYIKQVERQDTVYVQIFDGRNLRKFHSCVVIQEIFILKNSDYLDRLYALQLSIREICVPQNFVRIP